MQKHNDNQSINAFITVEKGHIEETIKLFTLPRGTITIGRPTQGHEPDVKLNDPQISRNHAEILYQDGTYWLRDLSSTNGTSLNGKLLEKKKDYPLTLLTGIIPYQFGSGTRSSRAWRLKKFLPRSFMEIGESDAKKLGISHGDKVKVISSTGEVTTTVRITNTLLEGMLFMPISFPETPVNELFGIALDPEAKTPSLKTQNVRIERIGLNG